MPVSPLIHGNNIGKRRLTGIIFHRPGHGQSDFGHLGDLIKGYIHIQILEGGRNTHVGIQVIQSLNTE